MNARRARLDELRGDLRALSDRAFDEVDAIAARPYVSISVDELKAELEARRAELRRPLERLLYTLKLRLGDAIAEQARTAWLGDVFAAIDRLGRPER